MLFLLNQSEYTKAPFFIQQKRFTKHKHIRKSVKTPPTPVDVFSSLPFSEAKPNKD